MEKMARFRCSAITSLNWGEGCFYFSFYSVQNCNLGQNGWKIKTTPPPISMMEKWRVFVVARIRHWIGGRGASISHFILSKIVALPLQFTKVSWLRNFNINKRTVRWSVLWRSTTKLWSLSRSLSSSEREYAIDIEVLTITATYRVMTQIITGAQPKAGTGHKMQTVSVVFSTLHCEGYTADLSYIACSLLLGVLAGSLKSYPPFWEAREDRQEKDCSFFGERHVSQPLRYTSLWAKI